MTAEVKRVMLAKAAHDWMTTNCEYSHGKPTQAECDEADAIFEATLIATQTIRGDDAIESIYAADEFTVEATIDDGTTISINTTTGNMLRGTTE